MNEEWAARFLEALGRMSIQAAVLVLLVLLAQRLFQRWLTPRWRCALWLLVVARIVLPASLPTPVSVFNLVPRTASKITPSPERSVPAGLEYSTGFSTMDASASRAQGAPATAGTSVSIADFAIATDAESGTPRTQALSAAPAAPVAPVAPHHGQIPWLVLLFAAWFAGAAGLAANVFMASVRVARRFRGLPEVSDPEVLAVLEQCRSRMRVRTPLRLVEGAEVLSPALHGIFRPRLLLPAGFTRSFSLEELHYVFLHELAHVKRMDVLMNWVVALLQIVHWFNPLLWFGFMRWRADRELACDAMALEAAGEGRNRDYGRTILRLLKGFDDRAAAPGLVGILEDKRQLQQRIGMIASFVPRKRWSLPAITALVGLAMIGLTDGQTPEENLGLKHLPAAKPIFQPVVPSVPDSIPRTGLVKMSEGRYRIRSMLDAIRIDSASYDGLSLSEVVKAIDREARNQDPEKKGINFILSTTAVANLSPPAIDPLAGLPDSGNLGLGAATTIRISPAQKNITLHQLLDLLVLVADRPIKYSVTDFGVVITERGEEHLTLHTRWYKVDSNTIMDVLQAGGFGSRKSTTMPPTPREETRWLDRGGIEPVNSSQEISITMIREYFESLGVDFSTPPRSLIYADRRGMLMVRATLPELEIVEKAVQRLNLVSPQVLIDAMFCEVSDDAMRALGLDWLPGAVTNSHSGPPTVASGVWVKGILTSQKFAIVLEALKQREDVKFLAIAKVLTTSGRQVQITAVESEIVRSLDLYQTSDGRRGGKTSVGSISQPLPGEFELGPVLVVPYVAADGHTIQMTVLPKIKEFIGYDLDSRNFTASWDYVKSHGANPPPARPLVELAQPVPLPLFRLRQVVSSATVMDGQTLVLRSDAAMAEASSGGGTNNVPRIGDLPFVGRLFRNEAKGEKGMNTLMFITPTIRTNSVPTQVR